MAWQNGSANSMDGGKSITFTRFGSASALLRYAVCFLSAFAPAGEDGHQLTKLIRAGISPLPRVAASLRLFAALFWRTINAVHATSPQTGSGDQAALIRRGVNVNNRTARRSIATKRIGRASAAKQTSGGAWRGAGRRSAKNAALYRLYACRTLAQPPLPPGIRHAFSLTYQQTRAARAPCLLRTRRRARIFPHRKRRAGYICARHRDATGCLPLLAALALHCVKRIERAGQRFFVAILPAARCGTPKRHLSSAKTLTSAAALPALFRALLRIAP